MEKAFEFDFVHDTQFVFRKLIDSMSKPMSVNTLERMSDKFPQTPYMCALGCTLLDNETSFYVEKDAVLARTLHDLTLSKHGDVEVADYIFLSSEINYETISTIFQKVKKGTLADPHMSATVIIYCQNFGGQSQVCVKSPGIKDVYEGKINQYLKRIFELKQEIDVEYPCGIDLIFLNSHGEIFAYPRLAKLCKGEK